MVKGVLARNKSSTRTPQIPWGLHPSTGSCARTRFRLVPELRNGQHEKTWHDNSPNSMGPAPFDRKLREGSRLRLRCNPAINQIKRYKLGSSPLDICQNSYFFHFKALGFIAIDSSRNSGPNGACPMEFCFRSIPAMVSRSSLRSIR